MLAIEGETYTSPLPQVTLRRTKRRRERENPCSSLPCGWFSANCVDSCPPAAVFLLLAIRSSTCFCLSFLRSIRPLFLLDPSFLASSFLSFIHPFVLPSIIFHTYFLLFLLPYFLSLSFPLSFALSLFLFSFLSFTRITLFFSFFYSSIHFFVLPSVLSFPLSVRPLSFLPYFSRPCIIISSTIPPLSFIPCILFSSFPPSASTLFFSFPPYFFFFFSLRRHSASRKQDDLNSTSAS